MATIGKLIFEMSANVARLQTDMASARSTVEKATGAITGAVNTAKVALEGLGVSLGAVAFVHLISDSIELQAHLQDLAESTGNSVEALSSMREVAATAHTPMDAVATALERLARSMAMADDPSLQAGKAFKALGISLTDSTGAMRPTQEVMQELGQKLMEMKDQTLAAAFAQQLMGRSGAQLLPFLYELARAGKLNADITTQQAEEAKKFEDNLGKLKKASEDLGVALANRLLPNLNATTRAMADAARQGDGFFGVLIAGWRALTTGDDQYKNDKALVSLTNQLLDLENQLSAAKRMGNQAMVAETEKELAEVKAKIQTTMAYRQELERTAAAEDKAAHPARTTTVANPFTGRSAKSGPDPEQEYMEQYIRNARQADEELKKLQTDDKKHADELARQNEQLDQQAQHWKDIVDPMAPYQRDLEQINKLLNAGKLTQEQWADASKHVQDEMDNLGKKVKSTDDIGKQLGMTFSSALEDAIAKGKSMRDVLQGIEQDIARIVLREAVTKPFASAIKGAIDQWMNGGSTPTASSGDFTAGGGFDNIDWASAASSAGASYATGTSYVPRDGLAYLHQGEAVVPAGENAGGGATVHFHVNAMDARSFMAYEPVIVGMIRKAVNRRGYVSQLG